MADEPKRIEATHGPYAGKRLDVPADVAEAAIADGWARDPFTEPGEVKEMTDEQRQKVLESAEKAARKLRGEEEPDNGKKAKAAKEDRSMEADKPAGYETRSSLPKSK